jgi:hypothetical protein
MKIEQRLREKYLPLTRPGEHIRDFGLFRCSPVGSRYLKGRYHFFNRNDGGVIIDRIGFFKSTKAFFDSFHTIEPFQGCLTDVISTDKKNRHGYIGVVGV